MNTLDAVIAMIVIGVLIWEVDRSAINSYATIVYDRAMMQKVVAEVIINSLLRLAVGVAILLLVYRLAPHIVTEPVTFVMVTYSAVYGIAGLIIAGLIAYGNIKAIDQYLGKLAKKKYPKRYTRWVNKYNIEY